MTTFLDAMYDYQKKHNTKGECIANAQILYTALRTSGYNVEVKPVIMAYSTDTDYKTHNIFAGHVVVYSHDDGGFLDPSYETHSAPNPIYYESIKEYTDDCPSIKSSKEKLTHLVQSFVKFNNIAKKMNAGEELVGDTIEYHNQLVEYVGKRLKVKVSKSK